MSVFILLVFRLVCLRSIDVGENNSYVWGLIEVTGTSETNGKWRSKGEFTQHLQIKGGRVNMLQPKK
jgi:hypothetical protein